MNKRLAVIAITKNGISIANKIKRAILDADIFVPVKFKSTEQDINWFEENTSNKIGDLFKSYRYLICIFSLGAVIRIISPHLKDKKTDPAVLVIDDRANFVISVLSGHLGGANELTKQIAQILQSVPVITTAADVNDTISVDLIGREFGWVIENPENITRISAMMVNEETIGLYQDAGESNWLKLSKIPENVIKTNNLETLEDERYRGGLIITDKKINNKKIIEKSVVYRPKNLVVGIGLHWDTSMETIESGIKAVFENFGLDIKCIRNIASIDKEKKIKGLQQLSEKSSIPIETFEKKDLLHILVPNPSDIVKKYEGTASVSEAASLISSSGNLIVPKQKFPPNLTVAVAKVNYQ